MHIVNKISIQNFKCFRKKESFLLSQGTYLIGANNAGKTAILNAIRFFFDDTLYQDESFLNRTEFIGKAGGYNRAIISLEFNINSIQTKRIKQALAKKYGDRFIVSKIITIAETSKRISITYQIGAEKHTLDNMPIDVLKIIKGISITYIHPQEGKELLLNAQEKLRSRLLANWGRNSSFVTQSLKDVQNDWEKFRDKARKYLSSSLTENIQSMWPESEISIDLPKNIRDIVAVSEINFKTKIGPDIPLTSQGTGAQSTILYLAHYLLDSDRSLHRGEYHPIWLLEEPESFLHADLVIQFAKQLNSESWLGNIQMIASTHSPLILALSRSGGGKVRWILLKDYFTKKTKISTEWEDGEIKEIGNIMGDVNFSVYFSASIGTNAIYIEDTREITIEKFKMQGISITKGLMGTPEVQRFLDVLNVSQNVLMNKAYFIIDADKGKKDFSRYLQNSGEKEDKGFKRFKVTEKIFIILLPEGFCCEDLFLEYDNFLEETVSKLYNTNSWSPINTVSGSLSRAHAEIRGKNSPSDLIQAKLIIKNLQDVKNSFWEKVTTENIDMSQEYTTSLKILLDL